MKSSLQKFQKELYQQVRRKAHAYQGEASKDLKHYRQNFKKQTSIPFELTNLNDLLKSVNKSQVVYLGDFHTFDQGSKNLERILKAITSKKNLVLAVEFISTQKQSSIDHYLAGHITEIEFLEEIGYTESWKFPWTHYKRFFSLAKDHNLKIVGLNTKGPLKERDIHAGQIISAILTEKPKSKILCIFGEYHIVPNKLPRLVEQFSGKELKQTIIYQNCDDVYWKLANTSELEKGALIKFDNNQFSLQTSPPWIKYESLIYWYENLLDDPHFDIHQYILNEGFLVSSQGTQEQFLTLISYFTDHLALSIDQDEIEDFNFCDYQRVDYMLEKIKEVRPANFRPVFDHYLKTGKSFFIPNTNIYFTPSHSINKISQLVGIHLLRCWRKTNELDSLDRMIEKYDEKNAFLYFLIHHSFTYIISKIINPYRKCDLYLDLVGLNSKTEKGKSYKISLKIFRAVDQGKSLSTILNKLNVSEIENQAKIIGKILGENIYMKLKKQKAPVGLLKKIYLKNNYDDLFKQSLPKNYQKQKKRFF